MQKPLMRFDGKWGAKLSPDILGHNVVPGLNWIEHARWLSLVRKTGQRSGHQPER